jgi:hypothetical protein
MIETTNCPISGACAKLGKGYLKVDITGNQIAQNSCHSNLIHTFSPTSFAPSILSPLRNDIKFNCHTSDKQKILNSAKGTQG